MIKYFSNRHILAILIGVIASAASLFLLGSTVMAQNNTDCKVTSGPFFSTTSIEYHQDDPNQLVSIKIQAENCVGHTVSFRITDDRYLSNTVIIDTVTEFTPIYEKTVITLKYRPGEFSCGQSNLLQDCYVNTEFYNPGENSPAGSGFAETSHPLGSMSYNCDGPCDQDRTWELIGPIVQQEVNINVTNDIFGSSSIFCNGENDTESNCYELLTPLPVSISSNGLDTNGDGQPDLELITAPVTVDGVTYNKQYLRSSPGSLSFGVLVNILVEVIIGILGLGAVIMIVIGGMSYMSAGGDIGKTGKAREQIWNAILGLLIALGSFIILNTINPNLLNVNPRIETVTLEGDIGETIQAPVTATGQTTQVFNMNGTYNAPIPTAGVSAFVQNLENSNVSLEKIVINSSTKKATFTAQNGNSVTVDINGGANGFSEPGQGYVGDRKTPKGNWQISDPSSGNSHRVAPNQASAVMTNTNACGNGTKKCNMGAAFVLIDIPGREGVAFHGDYGNNLGTTAGCIKMHNDDIIILEKYMTGGVSVIIQ